MVNKQQLAAMGEHMREMEECKKGFKMPDADGWIEWRGGIKSPVGNGVLVDVRLRSGLCYEAKLLDDASWSATWGDANITAYRLHKQEQVEAVEYNYPGAVYTGPVQSAPQFCESVVRSIPDPGSIDGLCSKVTSENKHQHVDAKPTIEQLAADYRNKLDYANRKQDEANKANMESDAALVQLEDAIAEIGFAITPLAATEKEPELVITDWQDLRVGDEIEVFNFECPWNKSSRKQELMSGPCIVMRVDGENVLIELKNNLPTKGPHWNATGIDACDFKFIRRP